MYKTPQFDKLKYPGRKRKVPKIFDEEEKESKSGKKRLTPQEARNKFLKGENG